MIKLKKLQEPSILYENKSLWLQQYKDAVTSGRCDLEALRGRYRDPQIKEQIIRETHGKCAYCESKILHVDYGDVEHIKPKSKFEEGLFDWNNLTLSCRRCNISKLNKHDDEIEIINPYENDPNDHLRACGPVIMHKPGSEVGELTLDNLDLNRAELQLKRLEHIKGIQTLLDVHAKTTNPSLKKVRERRIKEQEAPSAEFAMVSRAFIKGSKSEPKKKPASSGTY